MCVMLPNVARDSPVVSVVIIEIVLYTNVCRDRLVIPKCNLNMMSLRGQASYAQMPSLRGKLTALACHPTKYVNKSVTNLHLYKHWYTHRESLCEIKYWHEFTAKLVYWVSIVLIRILFVVHLKCSSFWPSADVKPVQNDPVPGSACLFSLCEYSNLYVTHRDLLLQQNFDIVTQP
jgi:hypothetical protein